MSTTSKRADGATPAAAHHPGDVLIRLDLAATAVFGLTAAYAAIAFTTAAQWVGAVTALTLFAVGVFAFLWAYWNAVQRSRTADISVVQLYLLIGPPTPSRVRRTMNLALVAQVLIAAITTFARPDGPDGNPGSSLTVGFLVPMLGFGLNGLWAAYHADFPTRPDGAREPTSEAPPDDIPFVASDATRDLAPDGATEVPPGVPTEVPPEVPNGSPDDLAPQAPPGGAPDVTPSGDQIGQNADHG